MRTVSGCTCSKSCVCVCGGEGGEGVWYVWRRVSAHSHAVLITQLLQLKS